MINKKPPIIARLNKLTSSNSLVGLVKLFKTFGNFPIRIEARYNGELATVTEINAEKRITNGYYVYPFKLQLSNTISADHVISNQFTVLVYVSDRILHAVFADTFAIEHEQLSSCEPSVVKGKEDFLFLNGGSNRLLELYHTPDNNISDQWCQLLTERDRFFAEIAVAYQQIFIPEKNTVLSKYLPYEIETPTKYYKNLKAKIAKQQLLYSACCFFEDHIPEESLPLVYRKQDTHLSTFGAELLLKVLLNKLKHFDSVYEVDQAKIELHRGDLGTILRKDYPHESVPIYLNMQVQGIDMRPELVHEEIPEGGNVGTIKVYRNDNAPIKRKLISFANSYFWQDGMSFGLTWWLSRLFEEYHFVWSPRINFEYVKTHSPDTVLGLAIERFMHRVPAK